MSDEMAITVTNGTSMSVDISVSGGGVVVLVLAPGQSTTMSASAAPWTITESGEDAEMPVPESGDRPMDQT
jgi:hypothetical protein